MSSAFDAKKVAETLDGFLEKEKPQRLLLQQMVSDEATNLALLSSPEVQSVLQKHGFFNIALEVRQEFQPLADKVAKRELTPEQMASEAVWMYDLAGDEKANGAYRPMKARGEAIVNFTEKSEYRGFSIHFVEAQHKNIKDYIDAMDDIGDTKKTLHRDVGARMEAQEGRIKKFLGERFDDASGIDYVAGLAQIQQKIAKQTATGPELAKLMEARREGDKIMAEKVKAIEDGSEHKTVILAGKVHGGGTDDFDEYLPGTAKVMLCGNAVQVIMEAQADHVQILERPDIYLDVSTGESTGAKEATGQSNKVEKALAEKPGMKI